MDILEYRDYCLSLPFVEESTPFDETTLVFKVGGRMFTYAGEEAPQPGFLTRSSAIPTKPSGCASATRGSRRRGTATNATGTTSTSTAI